MYLGLDIGTSGIKATIISAKGEILAHSHRTLTAHGIQEKKREIDPAEVYDKLFEVIRETIGCCPDVKIELITIAGLGEAVIPISHEGMPLSYSIVGGDPRGAEQLNQISEKIGCEKLVSITGLNLSYIYSLNKILYTKECCPEVHKKTWKYLCFTDYVGYILTGETKIDYSMASRTMAYDISRNEWSKEILSAVDISPDYFSQPVPGGMIIGDILPSVKEKMKVSYNIPVMVGSHDHIFNALGSGVVESDSCSNVVGTTEGFTAILEKRLDNKTIMQNQISCEPFVWGGLYNTVAWHNASGAMQNWFVDTFYRDSGKTRSQILHTLDHSVSSSPSLLMVLPHFAGSTVRYMDEKAKGAIIGLTAVTTREEIFKAVLEGAVYECRVILDEITCAGISLDKIVVSGGGSKSPVWMQLKANILGRQIYKSAYPDTGVFGGAILGSVVLKHYSNMKEAVKHMIKSPEMIEPDLSHYRDYQERYLEYKELYTKLKDLNHKLK
ncbi:MAG: sugar kinase [Lachnoclostridium sp.]|jgi:xylulokinase|nr:sugar kinase [Lachnoclostridium sp.]